MKNFDVEMNKDNSCGNDDKWVFAMLEEIARHPALWDSSEDEHKFATLVNRAWIEVTGAIRQRSGETKTVEVVKKRWKGIRDEYRKRQKKPTGSSGKRRKSKYDDALAFLQSAVVHRETISNIPNLTATTTEASGAEGPNSQPAESPDLDSVAFARSSQRGRPLSPDEVYDSDDIDAASPGPVNRRSSADTEPSSSEITGRVSSSNRKKKQRKPGSAANEDIDLEMLEILRSSCQPVAQSTSASEHDEYGRLVVKILDRHQATGAYPSALNELLQWITKWQCYKKAPEAEQASDDDTN